MSVKISVFTSPTCPHCPAAINVARTVSKEMGVRLVEISTATNEGSKKARAHQIMSVPTTIIKGDGYDQNIGFKGAPSKASLIKAVRIANGEEGFQEKKKSFGLGQKINSFIKDKFKIKIRL
ncbi:hypothetical protein GOV05_02195 [Candidatus Woesearchaeota archaeon]|nr:hypothetical protein [Candidatus Woesearchaeota archaeon]